MTRRIRGWLGDVQGRLAGTPKIPAQVESDAGPGRLSECSTGAMNMGTSAPVCSCFGMNGTTSCSFEPNARFWHVSVNANVLQLPRDLPGCVLSLRRGLSLAGQRSTTNVHLFL